MEATYIYNFRGRYYFRVRIPADLRSYFTCPFIKKSLKTTNILFAQINAPALMNHVEDLFGILRSGCLSRESAKETISEYLHGTFEAYRLRTRTLPPLGWTPLEVINGMGYDINGASGRNSEKGDYLFMNSASPGTLNWRDIDSQLSSHLEKIWLHLPEEYKNHLRDPDGHLKIPQFGPSKSPTYRA